jgi:hypothetical protein
MLPFTVRMAIQKMIYVGYSIISVRHQSGEDTDGFIEVPSQDYSSLNYVRIFSNFFRAIISELPICYENICAVFSLEDGAIYLFT